MSLVQILFQHSPTNHHSRAQVHLTEEGTFLIVGYTSFWPILNLIKRAAIYCLLIRY